MSTGHLRGHFRSGGQEVLIRGLKMGLREAFLPLLEGSDRGLRRYKSVGKGNKCVKSVHLVFTIRS